MQIFKVEHQLQVAVHAAVFFLRQRARLVDGVFDRGIVSRITAAFYFANRNDLTSRQLRDAEYRFQLAENMLRKFYLDAAGVETYDRVTGAREVDA